MNNFKNIYIFGCFLIIGALFGILISYIFIPGNIEIQEMREPKFANSYNEAIERASTAVVNIYSEQPVTRRKIGNQRSNSIFDNKSDKTKTSLGSGVVLSSDGYILTNQHVIGDRSIKVTV